ncbi:MAG: GNAT family N-acetyltransferase [Solirubrobacteraceae bacterium]
MRIEITREIESFAADAESYLAERVERNVPATVLAHLRRGRFGGIGPLFACCHDESGQLRAVAMRTPPWPMLASGFDAGTASPLIERWLAEDPLLPGISAQPPSARAIAAAWAGITGGVTRCAMREAMHALSTPNDPTWPARGRLRVPVEQERDLLVQWEADFVVEARAGVPGQARRAVATRMDSGAQRVWDDDGPVCALALSPAIAGTVRIGPVYTPPAHRGRGYASSAVAAACRESLVRGAQRCVLFTDLANATSNKIYADVGFRAFAEWEDHRFEVA